MVELAGAVRGYEYNYGENSYGPTYYGPNNGPTGYEPTSNGPTSEGPNNGDAINEGIVHDQPRNDEYECDVSPILGPGASPDSDAIPGADAGASPNPGAGPSSDLIAAPHLTTAPPLTTTTSPPFGARTRVTHEHLDESLCLNRSLRAFYDVLLSLSHRAPRDDSYSYSSYSSHGSYSPHSSHGGVPGVDGVQQLHDSLPLSDIPETAYDTNCDDKDVHEKRRDDDKRLSCVPYSSNLLTRLLQDSLGDAARTIVIVCVR